MPCNILVLPGGGVRGVVQFIIIILLHARTGFLRYVDIFAGTSIGGIGAILLALGRKPEAMLEILRTKAAIIFGSPWWWRLWTLFGILGPRFRRGKLAAALEGELGDVKFGDIPGRVCVLSRNQTRRKPKIWCNFPGDPDRERLARIIAEATAAAPTYLDPVPILNPDGTTDLHVDGGVVANDPSAAAFVEALRERHRLKDCRVLVIGTGEAPPPPSPWWARFLGWGLLRWLGEGLIGMLVDGPQDHVQMSSRQAMKEVDGAYHLVNIELPEEIDLAAADRIPELEELARAADLEPTVAWIRMHWLRLEGEDR